MILSFLDIFFTHIYRDFKGDANRLSKDAVGNMDGLILFQEYVKDSLIDSGSVSFFSFPVLSQSLFFEVGI